MRGLFLKIFTILWLAQSLIFVISTSLIVRQRFPSPNIVSDALDSNLYHNASSALQAYEANGCSGFMDNTKRNEPSGATLLDEQGQTVCSTPNAPGLDGLVPHFPDRADGRQVNNHYVWLIPVTAANDTRYEYVWFQPPSLSQRPPRPGPLLHFAFPQLPVAIAVGGLTTFVLVLLFSRPLIRLRKAARQLAEGDLSARVEESSPGGSHAQTDELQGLTHDFNHMAERLELLVGAQRLLLRDVSHELRSPLARLSVALELARDEGSPALESYLDRIERETQRLNQLIGQLLTLSSMEALDRAGNFEPVSLNQQIERMIPDAEYEAQQRHFAIKFLAKSECIVAGNAELLYRAIENVVRNAIRYTSPNTVVDIRLTAANGAGHPSAILEVSDEGPGVPEQELGHIFRPFYRVDTARSPETGGFGVGLAIAERTVRLHGGTVIAINRPHGGLTIRIVLPLIGSSIPRSEHATDASIQGTTSSSNRG
ncbi:MAG TPA: ATP-binding protein [Granulicella sp.]